MMFLARGVKWGFFLADGFSESSRLSARSRRSLNNVARAIDPSPSAHWPKKCRRVLRSSSEAIGWFINMTRRTALQTEFCSSHAGRAHLSVARRSRNHSPGFESFVVLQSLYVLFHLFRRFFASRLLELQRQQLPQPEVFVGTGRTRQTETEGVINSLSIGVPASGEKTASKGSSRFME